MPLSIRGLILACLSAASVWAQSPFQVHGYVQGRFTNQEGTPDRLEIRRARLIFSGEPVSDLSYTFQVDAAKTPYILDAALAWKPATDLKITAGQFKIPFSTESLIADSLNIPIARSRAVNSLAPGRDTGVQGRDLGFQISGALHRAKEPLLEFAVGVFRGQPLIEAPTAHYPATVGRLMLHAIHGLTFGADGYGSFQAPAGKTKRRWDAEGGYDRGPLKLQAEEIWARDGTLERRGGYALGAWKFGKSWDVLARSDWLTTNTARANATSVIYIAGVNWYWRKYVKAGFDSGAQHDQGRSGMSSVVLAQVMLSF